MFLVAFHKDMNSQTTLLSPKNFTQLLTLKEKIEEEWVIPFIGVNPNLYGML
jgi:hypothetical protein